MPEINILNLIMFDKGFVIKTEPLSPGTAYNLSINDGIQTIYKSYNPVLASTVIMDTWGAYNPADTSVCFTLVYGEGCNPLGCTLNVGG